MSLETEPPALLPMRAGCVLALSASLALLAGESNPPERSATLHGTVVDALSGQPTACNVLIIDAQGRTILHGEGFRGGFRCAGEFREALPPGKARLRVTRGFETKAVERELTLAPGQAAEVRVELSRTVDLRRRGWFAGDSHDHMLHGERTLPVTFDDPALAARAEDLQYLSLAQDWPMDAPTPEKLAAEFAARTTRDCVLTWNMEAPKNYLLGDAHRCLGHCWMLATQGRTATGEDAIALLRQVNAHDYEIDKPTFANFESHRLIHELGGAAFYTHPARWWTGPWGGRAGYPQEEKARVSNLAVELPLDTLLGPTFDGVDVITGTGEAAADEMAFQIWCLLLNHGYRVAATASSDACFDRPGGATPGAGRTYTFLKEPFSLPAVAKATVCGRTFATTGPLVLATVDKQPPGAALPADGQPRTLALEAWASGADARGLTRLEIWRNGQRWRELALPAPAATFATNLTISETQDAWYCVRAKGGDERAQRAITGAFFFDTRPYQPPAPAAARVRVELLAAEDGSPLDGTLTEATYAGPLPRDGRQHVVRGGQAELTIPATARLRATVPGRAPVVLSPFVHHPPLLKFISELNAEDLVLWETYEETRRLLGDVRLTFRLPRAGQTGR